MSGKLGAQGRSISLDKTVASLTEEVRSLYRQLEEEENKRISFRDKAALKIYIEYFCANIPMDYQKAFEIADGFIAYRDSITE